MDELKQRNTTKAELPQAENTPVHPTQDEWNQLLDLLCGLYDLQAEQLHWEKHQPILYATQEQMRELIREVGRLRMEIEQAGKKKERRFSLPKIHLPRFSLLRLGWPDLLFVSAMLLALWLTWPAWSALWMLLRSLSQ